MFLDDYAVAKMENLQSTMHSPTKKGAVVEPDRPWEKWLQTRCSPAWDPERKVYKFWVIAGAPKGESSGTAYVESEDGLHWTKPSLRQREYDGSKENNFVTLDPKLPWGPNYIEAVLRDPNDPDPSRRYKALMVCGISVAPSSARTAFGGACSVMPN